MATLAGLPLTLLLGAAWFVLFRPVTLGGPAGYIIVSGHSMEPTYWTGDLAITQRQDAYAIGDVIAFAADGGHVIHRIIGGDAASGYEVQGDNKDRPDLWRPRPDSIVGKAWLHVPQAGSVLALVRQPPVLAALAAAIAFFLAFTAGPIRTPRRQTSPTSPAAAGATTTRGSGP